MSELLDGASQECRLLGCQREQASALIAELRIEIERLHEENKKLTDWGKTFFEVGLQNFAELQALKQK